MIFGMERAWGVSGCAGQDVQAVHLRGVGLLNCAALAYNGVTGCTGAAFSCPVVGQYPEAGRFVWRTG